MEIEIRELELFIRNDGDLYRRMRSPIENNLRKHIKKGIFCKEKALKSYLLLSAEGAKKYAKEFAEAKSWNKLFSVADRKAVATSLLDSFIQEERIQNGN